MKDGIRTCHWHHAKFDLAGGCTLDPLADDVVSIQVEVRDGAPRHGHCRAEMGRLVRKPCAAVPHLTNQ